MADAVRNHTDPVGEILEPTRTVSAAGAAFRGAAVARRTYVSAHVGPEDLLGSITPPERPQIWTAVACVTRRRSGNATIREASINHHREISR